MEYLPWDTLDGSCYPKWLVDEARKSWTEAAFQEHRTGAACAQALQSLIQARAPVDMIAFASRFPLDEMVHVEMCALLAGELGGGTPLYYDPQAMIPAPLPGEGPLVQAADLMVRFFCVGEAISIPLLRGIWHASTHPLVKAVMGTIVKDEAAHGRFGWTFLDWAGPQMGDSERKILTDAAGETIAILTDRWDKIAPMDEGELGAVHALGWMETEAYVNLAYRSLETQVLEPLRARGITPKW